MGLHTVKCPNCHGSGRTGNSGYFYDWCKECGGTGTKVITDDEARSLLLQKQIEDAEL